MKVNERWEDLKEETHANIQSESRIRYLERMLKNAEIIEDTYAADQVGLNSVRMPE